MLVKYLIQSYQHNQSYKQYHQLYYSYFYSQFKNKLYKKFSTSAFLQMKCHLKVVGTNRSYDGTSSFMVFFDDKSYLFNCGETCQRLCNENLIKVMKFKSLFLSGIRWDCLGGLPGFLLTSSDAGKRNFQILGPPNLNHTLATTRSFIGRPNIDLDITELYPSTPSFKDDCITIHAIHVSPENNDLEKPFIDPSLKMKKELISDIFLTDEKNKLKQGYRSPASEEIREKNYKRPKLINLNQDKIKEQLPPTQRNKISISYIGHCKDVPGKFDAKAALALGLKPGPLYKELIAGKSVKNEEGVEIFPEQCVGPPKKGAIFIVMDCPNIEYINNLTQAKQFIPYQIKEDNNNEHQIDCIFHILGDGVLEDVRYQNFMKSFGKAHHIITSTSNSPNQLNYRYAAQNQLALNKLDENMFALPYFQNLKDSKDEDIFKKLNIKGQWAYPGLEYLLEPKRMPGQLINPINLDLKDPKSEPSIMIKKLKDYLQFINKIDKKDLIEWKGNGPIISTLGTGSAIPSLTRNVSSNLITLKNGKNILLDCGEGTLGQLHRLLGEAPYKHPKIQQNLFDFFNNLQLIYISHPHADHHMGIINLIRSVHKHYHKYPDSPRFKRYILTSRLLFQSLQEYSQVEDIGLNNWEFIDNYTLLYDRPVKSIIQKKIDNMMKEMGFLQIQTCLALHCQHAFCLSFTTNDDYKIVYSGDTRPTQNIIDIGLNCDILIHEATMDDDLTTEAKQKKHSTISEALKQAQLMKAKNTILTHFSQRYSSFKNINRFQKERAVVANDLLSIGIDKEGSDVRNFLKYLPALKKLDEGLMKIDVLLERDEKL